VSASSSAALDLPFDNSYAQLPEQFYVRLPPTEMPSPTLIRFNNALATEMGLGDIELESPQAIEMFTGSFVPASSDPIAMVYAGHQFGGYAPRLGDGRAILLGEIVGPDGVRRDVQLKGAGRTPFSRGGDGRAVLGPVLREYIVSEGMRALGIPTTRALAATLTGERVAREQLFPGAMLTRVSRSHVRIGTFQYFAAQGDLASVKQLADYVIERHYPEVKDTRFPYDALIEAVMEAQAELVAQWMQVGFIHGVMNTDNMQVAGETIDYGPCAFMDTYDPTTVYSSIDRMGRYAYVNQPHIAQWNLAWLIRSVLPIMDENEEAAVERAQAILDSFPQRYEAAFIPGMRNKLGLRSAAADDRELVQDFHTLMHEQKADFTLAFRALSSLGKTAGSGDERFAEQLEDPAAADEWIARWRERLARENLDDDTRSAAMRAANPLYIPRNHLVEEAIQHGLGNDFAAFETLLKAIAEPFDERPHLERLARPPEPDEVVQATF